MNLIRLFAEVEVPAFINAWRQDIHTDLWSEPFAVMVVSKTANPDSIRAACDDLSAVTPYTMPGMYLGPHVEDKTAGWFKRELWDERAEQFIGIRKAFDDVAELNVHFDLENFHDGNEATEAIVAMYGGKEVLENAMLPFLEQMGGGVNQRIVVPFICPAIHDDVCLQLIAERVDELFLLDEDTFALANEYRTKDSKGFLDTLKRVQRGRDKMAQKIPNGYWVPGFFHEEIFRSWATRYLKDAHPCVGKQFWTFNRDKKAAAEGAIPSARWTTGLTNSSLNDCCYFPLTPECPVAEWNYRGEFRTPSSNGHPYYELADAGRTDKSWSLAFDFKPGTDVNESIAANWQPDETSGGFKEWQIRHESLTLHFDWMEKGKDGSMMIGPIPADWSRIVLTWDVVAKKYSIAIKNTNGSIPSPNQLTANQPLRMGIGTAMIGGKRTKIYCGGKYRAVHYWPGRALSVGEFESAKSGNYPWGV